MGLESLRVSEFITLTQKDSIAKQLDQSEIGIFIKSQININNIFLNAIKKGVLEQRKNQFFNLTLVRLESSLNLYNFLEEFADF